MIVRFPETVRDATEVLNVWVNVELLVGSVFPRTIDAQESVPAPETEQELLAVATFLRVIVPEAVSVTELLITSDASAPTPENIMFVHDAFAVTVTVKPLSM